MHEYRAWRRSSSIDSAKYIQIALTRLLDCTVQMICCAIEGQRTLETFRLVIPFVKMIEPKTRLPFHRTE
jgi:hypothetical protein